jgi:hypothetical protein
MSKWTIILTFIVLNTISVLGQTTLDAEMMPKREICVAYVTGSESWQEYWEAQTLINNQNIGTLNRNIQMPMLAYGITNNLMVIGHAAYHDVSTTGGTTRGFNGWQDGGLALKWKSNAFAFGGFQSHIFGILGGSIPLTHYNNDAGPVSLGLGAEEVYGRVIGEIKHNTGIFIRPYASYHKRGTAPLERSFYYSNGGVYADHINVPSQSLLGCALGVKMLDNHLRIEGDYRFSNTIGGSDIRRWDMPLSDTNMDAESWSALIRYYIHGFENLGIVSSFSKILNGQNVGKSTMWSAGLTYQFSTSKNEKTNENK